jgi:hypothetical protein
MPKSPRSRKNLLIGLMFVAGVVVVVLLAIAVGTYLSLRQFTAPLMYLSGGLRLEEGIANKGDYEVPAGGELTPQQFALLASVEQEVATRLGERLVALREKSEELVRTSDSGKKRLPTRETLVSLGAIGRAYLDGKTAQIEALNRAGLSKDEFEWIREQAYHAGGLEVWQLYFADIVRAVPASEFEVRPLPHGVAVSPANRILMAPRIDDLRRWSALAFFGL